MTRRWQVLAVGILIAGTARPAWAVAPQAATTQTQSPPQTTPPPSTGAPDLSTDLARIREGLRRPDSIKLRQEGLRFYLAIIGKRMSVHEYLQNSDLRFAPVPGAGVTHQDFLNQITPKLLYSSGGIKAAELLEWGVVNWLGQMAVKKVFSGISDAMRDAEIRRIREQIDKELAALRGKDNRNPDFRP